MVVRSLLLFFIAYFPLPRRAKSQVWEWVAESGVFRWDVESKTYIRLAALFRSVYQPPDVSKTLTQQPGGYLIALPTDDVHYFHRRFRSYHPPELMHALRSIIGPGDHVCEIGSHLGEMTLELRHLVGSSGRVSVFEMDPAISAFVRDSIEANCFDNVFLHQAAIGSRADTVTIDGGYGDVEAMMEVFPQLNMHIYAGIGFYVSDSQFWPKTEHGDGKISHTVTLVDLRSAMNSAPLIDTYFMDIEGCEAFAVPQALELGVHKGLLPNIVFEFHHTVPTPLAQAMRNKLEGLGYEMSSPDGRHVFCIPPN